MEQKFKAKPNLAVGIFLIVVILSSILFLADYLNGTKNLTSVQMIVLFIFDLAILYYFLGCRPYAYVVGNKQIVMKKRLYKDKIIDLMKAEIITDPVPRLADLITRPHAIEIYMDTKKRFCFYPHSPLDFVGAVLSENKRIHCSVSAYTDIHRSIEKRERKRRKKSEKNSQKEA
ncbi:hypothetical protein HMPREF9943_01115 [Eggerthia catenaformis OT 569 = DSM 20559]|uniref:Uncharacterized protein n=1 Tax=Eggerthia catenaformis OT 569 = DSM 20559 TaxID=999415 RepID=M2Q2U3_9FIRM|nr:hypothetical protein [Eggerthia catenaformis]EMD16561.1 hypothetical protein HMPREF9943_01115 [Eggerthia catenaformis OT 569 = DSM 20559]OUC51173.1 hypothetical protein B7939_07740 [Eggerthia catenaformis]